MQLKYAIIFSNDYIQPFDSFYILLDLFISFLRSTWDCECFHLISKNRKFESTNEWIFQRNGNKIKSNEYILEKQLNTREPTTSYQQIHSMLDLTMEKNWKNDTKTHWEITMTDMHTRERKTWSRFVATFHGLYPT